MKDMFLTGRQYKEQRLSIKYVPSLVASVSKLYFACQVRKLTLRGIISLTVNTIELRSGRVVDNKRCRQRGR